MRQRRPSSAPRRAPRRLAAHLRRYSIALALSAPHLSQCFSVQHPRPVAGARPPKRPGTDQGAAAPGQRAAAQRCTSAHTDQPRAAPISSAASVPQRLSAAQCYPRLIRALQRQAAGADDQRRRADDHCTPAAHLLRDRAKSPQPQCLTRSYPQCSPQCSPRVDA
jgi:hypothetical protein